MENNVQVRRELENQLELRHFIPLPKLKSNLLGSCPLQVLGSFHWETRNSLLLKLKNKDLCPPIAIPHSKLHSNTCKQQKCILLQPKRCQVLDDFEMLQACRPSVCGGRAQLGDMGCSEEKET